MSMTTELAQRMKAAALNATGAYERLSMMPEGDIFDISLAEGTQLDADITALNSFHDEATPANVLELVEALEAAEKRNAELEARTVKLPEVRITIAESKLRNLTYQQLDAFNAGASRAVAKLS
ncbi:ead/Ea22-like family protein [Escherichia coli]